ncbi:MAG TPA: hypothetical protein VFF30_19845 [Nitrososphaerales archaeon]|nr:hypothetical protein [Nitrososphaerales archaeon]
MTSQYYARNRSDSDLFRTAEPRIVQVIKWAFANPDKMAAIGMGLIAFGVTAALLSRDKQVHDSIGKGERAEAGPESRLPELVTMKDNEES